jgi:hypothetical protein
MRTAARVLPAAAVALLLLPAGPAGAGLHAHPTISAAHFDEVGFNVGSRYAVSVRVRFRLCGAAPGGASATVKELHRGGTSAAARHAVRLPLSVGSGRCAGYVLTWPLDERYFGAGTYEVSLLVRDAHGAISNAAAHGWVTRA